MVKTFVKVQEASGGRKCSVVVAGSFHTSVAAIVL